MVVHLRRSVIHACLLFEKIGEAGKGKERKGKERKGKERNRKESNEAAAGTQPAAGWHVSFVFVLLSVDALTLPR